MHFNFSTFKVQFHQFLNPTLIKKWSNKPFLPLTFRFIPTILTYRFLFAQHDHNWIICACNDEEKVLKRKKNVVFRAPRHFRAHISFGSLSVGPQNFWVFHTSFLKHGKVCLLLALMFTFWLYYYFWIFMDFGGERG